jgi:hypothetical protein
LHGNFGGDLQGIQPARTGVHADASVAREEPGVKDDLALCDGMRGKHSPALIRERPQQCEFGLACAALLVWGALVRGEHYLSADFGLGYALGIVGTSCMLLLLLYCCASACAPSARGALCDTGSTFTCCSAFSVPLRSVPRELSTQA